MTIVVGMVLSERAIAFSLKERSPFSNKRDRPPRNAILFQKAGFVVGAIRESPLHYRSIPCFFQRAIAFFPECDRPFSRERSLLPTEIRSPFSQSTIAFFLRERSPFSQSTIACFFQSAIAFFLRERSLFYCYNKLSERNWSFPLCLK
ncbi:hypothetical protein JJD41_06230 [Oxynema sp. CENA135]|uniref:hypothetical protein n=1 Tax=Oxynema sp. CENA135 TaxID=984206 RepID=UPI001909A325|nr:hypothetical protein [Oxynema sp. CENA135]MBK4729462.1 hypothetical protein [Oxynema sp. CENA135]